MHEGATLERECPNLYLLGMMRTPPPPAASAAAPAFLLLPPPNHPVETVARRGSLLGGTTDCLACAEATNWRVCLASALDSLTRDDGRATASVSSRTSAPTEAI